MPRTDARLRVARSEAPRVLGWCAAVVVVISAVNWLEDPSAPLYERGFDLLAVLVLAGSSLAIARTRLPDRWVPWVTALGMTALGASLLVQFALAGETIGFTYLLIVLIIMGPVILDWAAWLTASLVLLAGVAPVVSTWPPGHGVDWMIVAATGVVAGGLVLGFRLRSINALADAQEQIRALATSDELTGLLNRHGFNEQAPRLDSLAQRLRVPVFAVFVDIDGLKSANDTHGHAFGDRVIQASARAVQESARTEDLVARWGGDEFVVLGVGDPPDLDSLAARLEDRLAASGIDRQRWPAGLSLGMAVGAPGHGPVEALLAESDADMYRRRQARRGGSAPAHPPAV